jgi:lia operon protein LiaF
MNTTLDRPRIAIGVILMLIGVLWTLSNLGILRGFSLWDILWGVFWIWLGATVVGPRGQSVGAARLTLGVVLLVIGALNIVDGIGLFDFSFGNLIGQFWPLILIALGFALLQESRTREAERRGDGERIHHDTILGDLKLTDPNWPLRDLTASTVIGDMQIDLSRAQIPAGETRIELRAVIGDIDIWVPQGLPLALEVQWAGVVTLNRYGHRQDLILRRESDAPPDFESAPRRVRVRVNLVIGDLSLTRAG